MEFEEQLESVRPPRYLLDDSDSDDEPRELPPTTRVAKPASTIRLSLRAKPGRPCVLAVGAAARVWAAGLSDGGQSAGEATVNDEQVAQALDASGVLVLLVQLFETDLSVAHALADALLDELEPSSLSLVDSYASDTYLSADEPDSSPPIRFLQSDERIVETAALRLFDVPNLVTSLTAAIATEASRRGIPVSVALLPSTASGPLAYAARSRPDTLYDPADDDHAAQSSDPARRALAALSATSIEALGWAAAGWRLSAGAKTSRFRWADDVLHRRRKRAAQRDASDASSMYL